MVTKSISITLDIDIIDYIDAYRGLITRSAFINTILRDIIEFDKEFDDISNNIYNNMSDEEFDNVYDKIFDKVCDKVLDRALNRVFNGETLLITRMGGMHQAKSPVNTGKTNGKMSR